MTDAFLSAPSTFFAIELEAVCHVQTVSVPGNNAELRVAAEALDQKFEALVTRITAVDAR